jgi:hypothetical protein
MTIPIAMLLFDDSGWDMQLLYMESATRWTKSSRYRQILLVAGLHGSADGQPQDHPGPDPHREVVENGQTQEDPEYQTDPHPHADVVLHAWLLLRHVEPPHAPNHTLSVAQIWAA